MSTLLTTCAINAKFWLVNAVMTGKSARKEIDDLTS